MPAPSPKTTPISLKTNGTSSFWLYADYTPVGSKVVVKRTDNGPGYWQGTVSQKHASNQKAARVSLTYNIGTPPLTVTRKRKIIGAGEIIEVTITVTNIVTQESGSIEDEAIVD